TGNGCNGSINIQVSGGTGDLSYDWSNGAISEDITDLCDDDYNVTITDDNGCILVSNIFTVLPPPLVVANSTTEDASCFGENDGSACINVFGGTSPYNFSIPGSGVPNQNDIFGTACFNNIPPGNYNVVIQDSGSPTNVIVHAISIGEPDSIEIEIINIINNTDPSCTNPNGAIDISVSGGTLPYSYLWSNNGAMV